MGQRAVLFDMDGVVIDNLPYHVDAWLLYCERHGIPLTREIFYKDLNGLNSNSDNNTIASGYFAPPPGLSDFNGPVERASRLFSSNSQDEKDTF